MKQFLASLFHRALLKSSDNTRTARYNNLSGIKTCGFVFSSGDRDAIEAVSTLETLLKELHISFEGRSFNDSLIPRRNRFKKDTSISQIKYQHINWEGIPADKDSEEFMKRPFDLLIDLSHHKTSFSFRYVLSHSKAHLIIGYYPKHRKYYDAIFPSPENGQYGPKESIEMIFKYLSDIK